MDGVDLTANQDQSTLDNANGAAESGQSQQGQSFDPATLPPELQTVYASMLADYTRKTQEVSAQRREIETQRQQMLDPRAIKAMAAAIEATSQPAQGLGIGELFPSFKKYADIKYQDALDPGIIEPLEAAAVNTVARTFIEPFVPYIRQLEQRIAQMEGRGVDQEWAGLVSQYPNAADLQPQVKAFMDQNPSAGLKQALFAVGGEQLFAARRTQEQPKRTPSNPEDRRGAGLLNPRIAASNGTTKREEGDKSMRELGLQEIRSNPGRYPRQWSA